MVVHTRFYDVEFIDQHVLREHNHKSVHLPQTTDLFLSVHLPLTTDVFLGERAVTLKFTISISKFVDKNEIEKIIEEEFGRKVSGVISRLREVRGSVKITSIKRAKINLASGVFNLDYKKNQRSLTNE